MDIQAINKQALSSDASPLYVINQYGHYLAIEGLKVDIRDFDNCRFYTDKQAMTEYLVNHLGNEPEWITDDSIYRICLDKRSDTISCIDDRGNGVPLDDTIANYVSNFEL